jgi:hypothetical protein
MNTTFSPRWFFGGSVGVLVGSALVAALAGLFVRAAGDGKDPPEAKRKTLAPNLAFEVQGDDRRVIVSAVVCLREGRLEGLLTKKGTKEHEYILAADVDARQVHTALEAAGAKAGAPVQFQPKYVAASGAAVKITLQYTLDGKTVTVPAQQWVRDVKGQKDLDADWVFGGSKLLPDPEDDKKPPFYLANQGDLVCVCNMDTAMLDLPIASTKRLADRAFEANADHIPPAGTKVDVIFEPVREKKDKDK